MGFWRGKAAQEPVTMEKPVRLLVIDDSAEFCRLLQELLKPEGFEVVTMNSPIKALELLSHGGNCFDVILLDYFMPRLDGVKTLEWLRKFVPKARIIICSGMDELQLRAVTKESGADGYIHKPHDIFELLKRIRDLIAELGLAPS
jgi:DNA-binding response OmpR family regulator